MGRTQIVQIIVSHSQDNIFSLQFTYLNDDGSTHISDVVGSPNFAGGSLNVIPFKGGQEFVTEVEGLYHSASGGENFKKLRIHTNLRVYKVFEADSTMLLADYMKFSFKFLGLVKVGGLDGTYNKEGEMTSIGVYFNDLQCLTPASTAEIDIVHGSTSN